MEDTDDAELRVRPSAPTREPDLWTPELLAKVDWRREAADEPLRGVVTSDGLVPNLYPLAGAGADTTRIREATAAYLRALTPNELYKARFPMRDVTWRHWNNGARYFLRHGLLLEELDDVKRQLALDVIRASLSEAGHQQVIDLMRLNLTIGEIRGETDKLNEWLYWFSVYGDPLGDGPFGWQLDGHHVNVNCALVGDHMVLTPTFLGAEPVVAHGGKFAGTTAFRAEEAAGQELFAGLSAAQRTRATIADELPHELHVGAFRDNWELDFAGLPLSELTGDQRRAALELIALYTDRANPKHAKVRMDEVLAHEGDTCFGWVGDPDGVFYYRLHSPVILVEFEHMAGVMYANDHPTRRHIHTIVRTPNGGDYGADLLRQHHARHPHNGPRRK